MASVRFNLHDKSKDLTHIFLVYAYAPHQYLRYSVKHKIPPQHWDFKKHRAKSTYKNYIALNRLLHSIETKCEEIVLTMRADGVLISPAEFKQKLDYHMGLDTEVKYLKDVLDEFFSPGNYHRSKKKIRSFKKKILEIGNPALAEVNYAFFDKIKRTELNRGNSPSYVNNLMKFVRQVAKEAEKRGYDVPDDYRWIELMRTKPKDQIYLNTQELEQMYLHQYSTYSLKNTMLLWMLGAWTSLRIGDYLRLAEDPWKYISTVNGRETINITSQKVAQRTLIPLHPVVKEILEKQEYTIISKQKLNDNIKVVGKEAGIDTAFTRMEQEGEQQVERTYTKYELITSHTGRRSFITNAYVAGIPKNLIMSISGHTTEKQLMEYVKLSQIEKYQQISGHEFFKEI